MKFKKRYIFILVLLVVVVITGIDFMRISSYKIEPRRPQQQLQLEQDQIYKELVAGKQNINWSRLEGTLEYINNQYDCADFRYVNLIRILYEYGDQIPLKTLEKIEKTLFDFRYWWDDPGRNSMCYWSENHQILFASAEYLIGQKYPGVVFEGSGLTGAQHMEKARIRILDWMEMRWNYGFIEFYSGVYYKEDVGAMINLIDFAEDRQISEKMKIIMDVLLYDVATQSIDGMFITVSGRAYEGNRKGGPRANFGGLTDYFWGNGDSISSGMMYGMMITEKYQIPPVLIDIAQDTNTVIIKQSNGLDVIQLEDEGYFGSDNRSMMMQWGMEAFTNAEIVRNSLALIREAKMFSNDFLKDFKILDFTLLKWLHLEPTLIRIINPQSNGVAIQKGNTYTYKTKDYTLYSVQNHHPGTYGDQQHVAGMNIGNKLSIFHTHPAIEADIKKQSPNYWVGYGHFPHVAQDTRVSLAIYNIPEKKGLMEAALLDYTHAYFPTENFDSTFVQGRYVFGKKGDGYCAFITANPVIFRENTTDDLIQPGKKTYWITEAGSKTEDNSFEAFYKRILANEVTFDAERMVLNYRSLESTYELEFGHDFLLNGEVVDVEYPRYDAPYSFADRKPTTITYTFNGKSLYLDFEKMIREF